MKKPVEPINGDPHRDREQAKYDQPIASREHLLDVIKQASAPLSIEKLAKKLGFKKLSDQREALQRRIGAMIRDGQLIENRMQQLLPVDADALITGRVSAHADGFGFLVTDDDDDIFLNAREMRQLLHGDKAVVCVTGTNKRGKREGRIVEVLERVNHFIVGRLFVEKGIGFVSPDNKRINQDITIPPNDRGAAAHGEIVVVSIVEQPSRKHPPVGKVVEVLGQHLQAGMEIDVALRSRDIPHQWPAEVKDQAAAFSPDVLEEDKLGRKDVRTLPLITIDGADARDFDDAVYCEKTKTGWRLLVAIADVAHYVVPGAPLDKEAIKRGTSVYFPGRVVPMLPEALSNGLCSLNPEVDRLCMLCEMSLDEGGAIKRSRFYNGVMRSHARLTYDQVYEMLTDTGSSLRKKFEEQLPGIETLHALYELLAENRRKRGVIEFDSNETHIVFDKNKKIKEIVPIVRNDAHKLIEECMILANVAAAAFLEQHQIPSLYRVHNTPKAEKLEDLRAFLALRGLQLGGGDTPTALDYAAVAEQIEERADRSIISTVLLRSMQQAVYQPRNEGHFGLALSQYAHFTSPIRRYPDLLVHRAIKHVLARKPIEGQFYTAAAMSDLGESCSTTERRAEEASRDVVSWLKCEYMQDHIGEEFDGVVSAVTSFGLFVELPTMHIEGLVHITSLPQDYYRYDQASLSMTGDNSGRKFQLGDSLRVRVEAVNLEDRKIDFSAVSTSSKASNKTKNKPGKSSEKFDKPSGKKDKKRKKPKASKVDAGESTGGASEKPVSAEYKRQLRRKKKQRKRDLKRAEAKKQKNQDKQKAAVKSESEKIDKIAQRLTAGETATSKANSSGANKSPWSKASATRQVKKERASAQEGAHSKKKTSASKKAGSKKKASTSKKVTSKQKASTRKKVTSKQKASTSK